MSFQIQNSDLNHSYVKLPEGTTQGELYNVQVTNTQCNITNPCVFVALPSLVVLFQAKISFALPQFHFLVRSRSVPHPLRCSACSINKKCKLFSDRFSSYHHFCLVKRCLVQTMEFPLAFPQFAGVPDTKWRRWRDLGQR